MSRPPQYPVGPNGPEPGAGSAFDGAGGGGEEFATGPVQGYGSRDGSGQPYFGGSEPQAGADGKTTALPRVEGAAPDNTPFGGQPGTSFGQGAGPGAGPNAGPHAGGGAYGAPYGDGATGLANGVGGVDGSGPEPGSPPAQKKSTSGVIVAAAVVVALLVVGALVWFLFFRPAAQDAPAEQPTSTAPTAPESPAPGAAPGDAPETSAGVEAPAAPPVPGESDDAPAGSPGGAAPGGESEGAPDPEGPSDGAGGAAGHGLGQELGGRTGTGTNNHAGPPIGQTPPR